MELRDKYISETEAAKDNKDGKPVISDDTYALIEILTELKNEIARKSW